MPRSFVLFFLLVFLAGCAAQEPSTVNEPGTYAAWSADTEYVGIQVCADCHEQQYQSYSRSQMGRSFKLAEKALSDASWDVVRPIHSALDDLYYQPFADGEDLFVHEYRLAGADTVHSRIEQISRQFNNNIILTDSIQGEGAQLFIKVQSGFEHYYDHHISSVRMALVDLGFARQNMNEATEHYNQLQIDLFKLLDVIRQHTAGEFAELREFNQTAIAELAIIALIFLAAMLASAIFFSRSLIDVFNLVIGAITNLGSGNSHAAASSLAQS